MCSIYPTNPAIGVVIAAVCAAPLLSAAAGVHAPAARRVPNAVDVAMHGPTSAVQADGSLRFDALARECAPGVAPTLLGRVATVESSGSLYAIGVVGGQLIRQPKSLREALATTSALTAGGWNYSMGLVQVNVHNLARYGQTTASIFDPCTNLKTGAAILQECYKRAIRHTDDQDEAVQAALSCYRSGTFSGGLGYARKVAASHPVTTLAAAQDAAIPVVPDVHSGATPADGAAPAAARTSTHISNRVESPRTANGRTGDDWFTTWGDDDDAKPETAAGVSRPDLDQGRKPQ